MSAAGGQARFAAALQDPALPVPPGVVSPRGDADPLRFAVYRNNVHVGLVGVLAASAILWGTYIPLSYTSG